jgi:phosphohistidine phosphatase SixA
VGGHHPTLGRAAALALIGRDESLSMRKASVWWLKTRSRRGRTEVVLTAVMSPELV